MDRRNYPWLMANCQWMPSLGVKRRGNVRLDVPKRLQQTRYRKCIKGIKIRHKCVLADLTTYTILYLCLTLIFSLFSVVGAHAYLLQLLVASERWWRAGGCLKSISVRRRPVDELH